MAERRPLRIGFVDLDTSHPAAFLPLLRAMGHEVVAVCDAGTVRPPGTAELFARRHAIPEVVAGPSGMIGLVDAAFILGCDWEQRLQRAQPLVEAGVSVFLDKPVAGTARELDRVVTWKASGHRVAGGSALRWFTPATEWARTHGAGPAFALAGTSGHPLDFGVHAYSLLQALLGPNVASVRDLGGAPGVRSELWWTGSRRAVAAIWPWRGQHPYYATVAADDGVVHLTATAAPLYRSLLEATLPYLAGESPDPTPGNALVLPERCALAALASGNAGGRPLALTSRELDEVAFASAEFVAAYPGEHRAAALGPTGAGEGATWASAR